MPWSPAAVPPALAAARGRVKKRAGLPRLLHRLFIKVLRLRPSESEEPATAFGACRGCRTGSDDDDEDCCYCYCYGYGGAGSSWAAGVLSSIPEEEADDDSSEEGTSSPDVVPAALRKATSEGFVVGPPVAATVVRFAVLL